MQKYASINMRVVVMCEACNTEFFYDRMLEESGGGMSNPEARVMRRVAEADYGVMRCPKCSYLQSWMQIAWKRSNSMVLGFIIALPIILLIAQLLSWVVPQKGWPFILGLLGCLIIYLILAALGYMQIEKMLIPNWLWHRKHGNIVIEPREPSIIKPPL